jgi:hypothetical protein
LWSRCFFAAESTESTLVGLPTCIYQTARSSADCNADTVAAIILHAFNGKDVNKIALGMFKQRQKSANAISAFLLEPNRRINELEIV